MATTYTTTVSIRTDYAVVTAAFDNTEEQATSIDVTLTANQVDKEYSFVLDGSKIKSYVFMLSSAGTMKVYSGVTLNATIAMSAGVPLFYYNQQGTAFNLLNAFTGITKLLFTNGAAVAATGVIRVLYDPTP